MRSSSAFELTGQSEGLRRPTSQRTTQGEGRRYEQRGVGSQQGMATLRAVGNEQQAAAAQGGDGALAAAGVPSVVDTLAKLTVSTGTNPAVPPTFQFVPESLEQVRPGRGVLVALVLSCRAWWASPLPGRQCFEVRAHHAVVAQQHFCSLRQTWCTGTDRWRCVVQPSCLGVHGWAPDPAAALSCVPTCFVSPCHCALPSGRSAACRACRSGCWSWRRR